MASLQWSKNGSAYPKSSQAKIRSLGREWVFPYRGKRRGKVPPWGSNHLLAFVPLPLAYSGAGRKRKLSQAFEFADCNFTYKQTENSIDSI